MEILFIKFPNGIVANVASIRSFMRSTQISDAYVGLIGERGKTERINVEDSNIDQLEEILKERNMLIDLSQT